jgi:3-hydroxyisobutyrate dehydrogenase-like beta-hydroxyacid dehydrogenase
MKRPKNVVLSFWLKGVNILVISTTSEKVAEELKEWAKKKGYRVVDGALDEES